MAHLVPIVGAFAVWATAEWNGASGPLPWWTLAVWLVLPRLVVARARNAAVRGAFRRAAVGLRLVGWSGVLGFLALAFASDWFERVEAWTGLAPTILDWPTLASFVAFVPALLFELVAIDARARFTDPSPSGFARARRFAVRQYLATLLPFAGFGAVGAALGASATVRTLVEEVALYHTLFAVTLVVTLATLLPAVLVRVWETQPLPASLARSFDALAERAGVRLAGHHLWITGGSVANAAVVGFSGRTRRVFVTDAIVGLLPPLELLAVFAHELGHARRGHPATFAQLAVVAFVALELAAEPLADAGTTANLAVAAGALVLFLVGFGWASRRFELEADLESLELVGEADPLVLALARVSPGRGWGRHTWRHFSPGHRAAFLARVQANPEEARPLRRRLDVVRRVASVGSALAVVALLVSQARGWGEDHAWAELRLGDYETALARDVEVGRAAELLELVATLPRTERTPERFVTEARAAAARGDAEAFGGWIDLAALRGDEAALDARRALDDDEVPAPAAWADELRALASP